MKLPGTVRFFGLGLEVCPFRGKFIGSVPEQLSPRNFGMNNGNNALPCN